MLLTKRRMEAISKNALSAMLAMSSDRGEPFRKVEELRRILGERALKASTTSGNVAYGRTLSHRGDEPNESDARKSGLRLNA
jgi:hypothetical protein